MKREDYKPFCEIVGGFAELKGKQLSAAAIDLYWHAMADWTLEDFRAAATHLLKTSEFMPTPKSFEDLRKAGRPTPAEAWARVLQHCKGAYRNGSGLDNGGPIDSAVAGLGGYKAVAFQDLDYLPAMQRQFIDRYAEQQDVDESRQGVPQIANDDPVASLPRLA